MIIRKANTEEFDEIYMMGFAEWSSGASEIDYLNDCRNSAKYASGTWFVLSEGSKLLSSLIVYELAENNFGIGSISTAPQNQKHGYASKLITGVVSDIEKLHADCLIFLYSDINAEFYEKFKFIKLPMTKQRYKNTSCMVYGNDSQNYLLKNEPAPDYF